jgi:hypothetical protein
MRRFTLILLIFTWANVRSLAQVEPIHIAVGEVSRFDSLIASKGNEWTLSPTNIGANEVVLQELAKIYPNGATWERSHYKNEKHTWTVDRWFFNDRRSSCKVLEKMVYSWGGVFCYMNGVRIETLAAFEATLQTLQRNP